MIKIECSKNCIQASGHANYEMFTKDIVCAGVSAIIMGAINWFDLKDVELEINEKTPLIKIKLINQDYENQRLISLIQTQLMALTKEYSKYVKIYQIGE